MPTSQVHLHAVSLWQKPAHVCRDLHPFASGDSWKYAKYMEEHGCTCSYSGPHRPDGKLQLLRSRLRSMQ